MSDSQTIEEPRIPKHFITAGINHLIHNVGPKISPNGVWKLGCRDMLERAYLYAKLFYQDAIGQRRERQPREIAKAERGDIMYINLVLCDNCYGGPEEGGWYYTEMHPIASIAVDPDITDNRRRKLERRLIVENADALADHGYDDRYLGHGIGGAGDDEGMLRGQSEGGGFDFTITYGVPYEWEGAPRYE